MEYDYLKAREELLRMKESGLTSQEFVDAYIMLLWMEAEHLCVSCKEYLLFDKEMLLIELAILGQIV